MDIGGLLFGERISWPPSRGPHRAAGAKRAAAPAGYVDGLTGIANRRQFDQQLEAEWRLPSQRQTAGRAAADIDYSQTIQRPGTVTSRATDTLKAVATTAAQVSWGVRMIWWRYGGEEIVCLLPECDAAGALHKGQELCHGGTGTGPGACAIAAADVVTISVGVVCQVPDGEAIRRPCCSRPTCSSHQAKGRGATARWVRTDLMSAHDAGAGPLPYNGLHRLRGRP